MVFTTSSRAMAFRIKRSARAIEAVAAEDVE
jgi:hypothetical protein